MRILGIETSCDETAVAIVDDSRAILGQRILSQVETHAPHGGIVPELAARAHLDHLGRLIDETLAEAQIGLEGIDAIAATTGPGLIGGLIVGATMGKAMAMARRLPFVAVNHLEGHALSARLSPGLDFPYLLLLVSGGHCQLLVADGIGRYRRLGGTIDDAVGEAFDKTAKLLGLPYPGGPAIERLARGGNARRFALPRPLLGRPGCDFSFAGLKTAVRQITMGWDAAALAANAADMAASFQAAVGDVLADRVVRAIAMAPGIKTLVVAGGVAANQALRARLGEAAGNRGVALVAPPMALCTDNAAMIAWAALEHLRLGPRDDRAARPRPRWPLEELAP